MSRIYVNGCEFNKINDSLNITLSRESNLTVMDLFHFINKYDPKVIRIDNICKGKELIDLFNSIKKINFNGEIIIDFNSYISIDKNCNKPLIEGFNNRSYIDLNNLPDNLTIKAFDIYNNTQNEFTTWIHNQKGENKLKIYNVLSPEDKKAFIKEELIIRKFYDEFNSKYPNSLNTLSKQELFDLIYDYFSKEFSYASECLNSNGFLAKNCSWAQSSVQTFEKRRGVCEGRANLLTLVTNNNLFRLNCTVVNGKHGIYEHAWNQFIDDNNNLYDYDLSYGLKRVNSIREMKSKNYKYSRVYPIVLDVIEKKRKEPILNLRIRKAY